MSPTWEGLTGPEWAERLGLPAVRILESTPSTNAEAGSWIREGAPHLGLVVAEAQTAGRGRRGRSWHSPPGRGIWASLLGAGRGLAVDGLLPIRLGIALAGELDGVVGPGLALKWPNDLVVRAPGGLAKVGGLLCERVSDRVVLGVGLNVVGPVEVEADPPAAALDLLMGPAADRGVLLEAVVAAGRGALERRSATLSPPELDAWRRRDVLTGQAVTVDGRPSGVVRGLAPDGSLRVDDGGEVHHIRGGRVRPVPAGV